MTGTIMNSCFISVMEIIAILIVIRPVQKKSHFILFLLGLGTAYICANVAEQLIITSYVDNLLIWLLFEVLNFFIISLIIYSVAQTGILDSIYFSVWSVCLFQLSFTASVSIHRPGALFFSGFPVFIPIYGLLAFFLFKDSSFNYRLKATTRDVVIAAFTHFPINLFNHILFNANDYDDNNYLLIFATVFSYACCMFVLYLHRMLIIHTRLSKEISIINELWQQRQSQFEITSSSMDFLSQKTHDLMHALSELYKLDDRKQREEYLDDLSRKLKVYDAFTNTGNKALDTILSQANLYCESKEITFKSMICSENLGSIEIADLYAILNNALENAFDNVLKIDDPDYRIVNVGIQEKAGLLLLSVENASKGDLDGSEKSSYRFKSMSHAVEKYSGKLTTTKTDELFRIAITIPIKKDI